MNRRLLPLLPLLAAILSPPFLHAQSEPVRDKNVVARFVSDQSTIAPGKPFTLGLELTIDETWHTYWINPGETGKPTTLELTLPEGFTAGPLGFPVPKRFVTDYSTPQLEILEAGFGYEHSVIHPVTITPPSDLEPGTEIAISGKTTFLMCDPNTCVPGKAELTITLPVAAESVRSTEAMVVDSYAAKIPAEKDWPVEVSLDGARITIAVGAPADAIPADSPLQLFPYETYVFEQLSEPEITRGENEITFVFDKHPDLAAAPENFAALIIAETQTGKKGYRVTTGDPTPEVETTSAPTISTITQVTPPEGSLFRFLVLAFFGGMILNIMPCVFPVISLKVMSFVGQAGEDQKKVLAHSAVFTLGILIFFWVLAAAVIVLRLVGEEASWGFQMQYPGYVLALIFIMTIVALSLFGVFEIGTSLTGVGGELVSKSGYAGSFWSGALAVLLATPCTAPLMAPAVAFALLQTAPVLVLIFTALGLGLAAPYFVLAAFPKLLDMIPPPGGWMDTFKQLMGFPMLAVVVWLAGVLSVQLTAGGLQWALAAMLLVSAAAWVLGQFCTPVKSNATRTKGRITAVALFVASLFVAVSATGKRVVPTETDLEGIIAGHRAAGKHVFVDFTAEWCLTCKVNERTTIKTEKIQNAFRENNVEFVIADWTNEDPGITKVLKQYGRSGVPFYLMYPADLSREAIPLGDGIVTPGAIFEAIEAAKGPEPNN